MIECPQRDYAVVPTPGPMQWDTIWPIPAPEVIAKALETPLKGLWVDHVPTGAEIAAMNLGLRRDPQSAWTSPLVTGDWANACCVWGAGHPERMSPQMAMPDAWFDHDQARRPPPGMDDYEPATGKSVRTIIGVSMSGSGNKHDALELPALWRRGLLRTPDERVLAEEVLSNANYAPETLWYQIVLDEGWTMRRAAQVLREAGVYAGELCAWTNRWARPPVGTPQAGSAQAETAWGIDRRCRGQLWDDGRWPLSRTEEIAAAHGYRRVE